MNEGGLDHQPQQNSREYQHEKPQSARRSSLGCKFKDKPQNHLILDALRSYKATDFQSISEASSSSAAKMPLSSRSLRTF